jgi:hypothetical protein
MAIATQVVNGETITFDTEVRDSIFLVPNVPRL